MSSTKSKNRFSQGQKRSSRGIFKEMSFSGNSTFAVSRKQTEFHDWKMDLSPRSIENQKNLVIRLLLKSTLPQRATSSSWCRPISEISALSFMCQGYPTTVFCKISSRRSKYCLEFCFTWGQLKISGWPFHSCTIFESLSNKFITISEV